ncbi:MAG: hypothetical protein ACOC3B_01000 [Bacillota bacterium]
MTGSETISNASEVGGTIRKANLTDSEESLLKAVAGNYYFVLDVELDDLETEWVNFNVEYYYKGQKERNFLTISSLIEADSKNNRIIFNCNFNTSKQKEYWNAAFLNDISIISGNDEGDLPFSGGFSSTQMTTPEQQFKMNEEILIAVIVGKDMESEVSSIGIDKDIFLNKEALEEFIELNQHVYLMKCEFKENIQSK